MEIFKQLTEYPMYSVSTLGRIVKNDTRREMKPSYKPSGYLQINLFTNDGRRKKEYVHRLVALAFLPRDQHRTFVNHIDGVRDNNRVENLEWVTHSENMRKSSLLKPLRVLRKDGSIVGEFSCIQDACDRLDLIGSNVSSCLHGGAQKSHRGYVFELI